MRVAVRASDAIVGAGAVAYLRGRPGLVPVLAPSAADVVLVLADQLSDDLVAWMQQVSGPPARPEPRGPDSAARPGSSGPRLDGREIDVLRLLADGRDTAEIARRLNYSERTIKSIVRDILNRLELRNRSHAVAFAIRHGWL